MEDVCEKARKQWALFTREYLLERENLLAVMLLIDSTIKPQKLDLECLDFLGRDRERGRLLYHSHDAG